MSFLGLFKTPEEKAKAMAVKKRRAKLTEKVQKVYEKEYEKQFEKQALEKAQKMAQEKARKKVYGGGSVLAKIGSVLEASDKYFAGKPTQAHTKAHGKAVTQTKKSTKTVADLLKEMPQ